MEWGETQVRKKRRGSSRLDRSTRIAIETMERVFRTKWAKDSERLGRNFLTTHVGTAEYGLFNEIRNEVMVSYWEDRAKRKGGA